MEQNERAQEVEQMRLGRFEFKAMNNGLRRWVQKHIEMRIFRHMLEVEGIELSGSAIVDAGCGSGYSTKLILETFAPRRLVAFDLMPEQIALARKRLPNVDFFVADMTRTGLQERSADAVFIFGVIHHIPRWQAALEECARIMKPGGVLLIEEPLFRFTWEELEEGFLRAGFSIIHRRTWLLGYFRSYLCR